MKTWFITTEERQALKRAIKLLELKPATLFLACFLGAAGLGATIALGATAAWLIARASQMPPVLYLEVAVVSVRFFGISKAVFRYLERLASHKLGVSGMTTLRTNLYKTLSYSDTARIASLRRGDILDRMGTDVDNIGDFVVKSLLPAMVATIVGIITVVGISLVDWRAGLFLALGLLLSGLVGPLFTIRATRISQQRETQSRAQISEVAMTMVDGAAQITVDGQTQQVLSGLSKLEDQLYEAKDSSAKPAALAEAIDVFGGNHGCLFRDFGGKSPIYPRGNAGSAGTYSPLCFRGNRTARTGRSTASNIGYFSGSDNEYASGAGTGKND